MAIPDFQSIMLPFMQTLEDGQTWTMKDLTERLTTHYNLTDVERHELLPSGQQAIFSNRVAWAKSHLKNAGLIANPSRGKVSISDVGQQVLQQNPIAVNCKFLKQFPSYLKFIERGGFARVRPCFVEASLGSGLVLSVQRELVARESAAQTY